MKARTATWPAMAAAAAAAPTAAASRSDNWIERTARRLVLRQLEVLAQGEITFVERGTRVACGRCPPTEPLSVTVEVLDPQFWVETAFGGTVGAGEAYMRDYWKCDDLTSLVRIMVINAELLAGMEQGWAWLSAPLRRIMHFLNRNSRNGSRRNISAHYDLGNELFALFLDPTLAYSCGIFEHPHATLHEASLTKFDAICRKLDLQPQDHLLEIGTGWGGLAIHAAQNYGCRVTTTTISREQYELATQKVAAAGLSDRITLLLQDYRELEGQYDKLVSVEMVEAVGHRYLGTYFKKCSSLLKPAGSMLLQAITIRDQMYESALKSVDFIQRYIFPGSFIPSIAALTQAVGRSTDMKVFHLQDIGPHYATTLRHWRETFFANIAQIKALGYPDTFIRMWEYYLCYCEGGFIERQLGDVHMLLTKPNCRRVTL